MKTLAIVGASFALALAGQAMAQTKPPVKIGNITFMTGPTASSGQLLDAMADLVIHHDIGAVLAPFMAQ